MTVRLVLLACSSAAALTLTQEKHLAKPNVRSLTASAAATRSGPRSSAPQPQSARQLGCRCTLALSPSPDDLAGCVSPPLRARQTAANRSNASALLLPPTRLPLRSATSNVVAAGLNTFPHDKYIAVAMIGWAVGKLSAVMGGVEATKRFASLNCIPLTLWLLTSFRGGAPFTTSIMPAVLLAGYVYAGFIED
eukprot:CAMPEP_0202791844 /NCGR_PEP_ID=MMETSP1388-20130828/82452_1 /ASSEMBLY_ACC=CAM_ASM_000864 /TAXON_ID=37098 /ORGANISM="Isochrysis sp, Strain CCMP1244" /LENGTH=192 /DNA_ID=CAMNT_0049461621 /DNA_START=46 /DNA_END=626 /DNA_ORIENTATION=-